MDMGEMIERVKDAVYRQCADLGWGCNGWHVTDPDVFAVAYNGVSAMTFRLVDDGATDYVAMSEGHWGDGAGARIDVPGGDVYRYDPNAETATLLDDGNPEAWVTSLFAAR